MDRPWSRVPGWVGAALRPELAGATDEVIAAVRAEVPDYARPLTGRFGMRITEGVSVALGQFIDLLGRDEPLGDAVVYRALGQLEHREGRTLAALQSAYQVGTRTMWRRLGGSTTARQLPPEVIFSLAEALFSYVEQISAASVAGWAYEESSRASSMQARRHALVELLARQPPAAPAEVERVAAAAGWVLPGRLAALVVEDAVAVAGRLPGAIGADLDPVGVAIVSVGATRNGPAGPTGTRGEPTPDGTGWLDRLRAGLGARRAVLGPVVEPAQAHRSIARAQAAWPLHVAGLLHPGSDETLARADEHLLALLLAAEPQLAADLYERAVAPLRTLPAGAAARGEETLRAWLDAHGDITATAAALHVHPQTVRYRLAGLRDAFGGALDDPAARLELAVALRMSVDSCTGTDHPPEP
ncbi:helix-turn-helix domain-containing protein [Pseudonocardia yunnanensis]|uniref:Helix-turn-helix domain-containing protein n=1 Tax=Pseudonocardia yunnanensis TaxID=58107 RepID=A0ABW4F9X6_9PSEU